MFRCIFIISLIGLPLVKAEQYMKLYNIVCETNPKFLENVSCALNVVGRQKVVANMEVDTKMAFKNISVHFKLFKFYNQFRPFLIDVTFNACDVINKKKPSNFYSNLVVRVLSKFSNSTKCYLEQGRLEAKNLDIKYEFIKFFLENGKYKFSFEFLEGFPPDYIGRAMLYSEVFEKYNNPEKQQKIGIGKFNV